MPVRSPTNKFCFAFSTAMNCIHARIACAQINAIVAYLSTALDERRWTAVVFKEAKMPKNLDVPAFAMPGRRIAISDWKVSVSTDNSLALMLAHEMGMSTSITGAWCGSRSRGRRGCVRTSGQASLRTRGLRYRSGRAFVIRLIQRKTQRPVQFELTESTRKAVGAWLEKAGMRSEQYLFPSRLSASPHLSTRQYARMIRRWADAAGLEPTAYGTHSMRRTKATLIYKRTKNLRAVQLLLGHSKIESTIRYRGIEVDDALEISEQTEI
ncbi:tyrosine-type recombinase/integrase [Paraburkholderia atlantica]|uniref:tyrosine-type recombinase/integrase n=2 Tax=Paraburkholderia atlantica TaxID=2654982 RepID=UPI003D1D0FC4